MKSIRILLPDDGTYEWLQQRAERCKYSSVEEFLSHILSQTRVAVEKYEARLEAALLEGLHSGEPLAVTEEFWAERERELQKRLKERGDEV